MFILSPTDYHVLRARKILEQGGIIIYPTDTLYGFGADIRNKKAIKKIFNLKGRKAKSPMAIVVSSLEEISQLAHVNEKQERFINAVLPGPFTILLRKKRRVSQLLTAGTDKVGIRFPDSNICQKISRNMPITTTSVNITGAEPILDSEKLVQIFGQKVDLILTGKKLSGRASMVIDLTKEPFKILRI